MALTPKEKIIKAKIELFSSAPFFSFITNHMGFIEDSKNVPTIAVDSKGRCYFNNEFVEKLTMDELKAVISHEAMHCALEHMKRRDKRDAEVFNWATDIVVNNMLINSNMRLPAGLLPFNNAIKILNITITDIDKKTAEAVYTELLPIVKEKEKIKQLLKSFDIHIENKDDGESGGKDNGGLQIEVDWKQVIANAGAFARQQGKGSGTLDRMVELALENKINWKVLLSRYMTSEISNNYSYARPSKRSFSAGAYLPYIQKENMNVTIAIDTSGSIQNKELSLFLGQVYNIVRSFHNIKVKILYHDDSIGKEYNFNNMNLNDIKKLKPIGGGGTSHQPIMDYVNKHKTNILICFTDGYSDINHCTNKFSKSIFVLTTKGCDKPNYGKSIYFEREE